MPTSGGNAAQRDADIEALQRRMDKLEDISNDLRTIVIALKSRADTNQKWVSMMLTVGATLVGAVIGGVVVHLLH